MFFKTLNLEAPSERVKFILAVSDDCVFQPLINERELGKM